ncbi:MAG: hypothetical protein Q8O30_01200 [Candidatus Omnitrophota bacterium]|nr:hypothetical protein [Candidatus Omnitrophota bacterium]
MKKKRSVEVRRIIFIALMGFLTSLFVVPCSLQMAIAQEQSNKEAIKEWEQYYGMTAEEYWQGLYNFEKERKEKRAKADELVRKYFGKKYQGVDDLTRQGVALPQKFVEEFQSLGYQDFPPKKFRISPPPVEPPEWFKKEVLSESKETSSGQTPR